MTTAQKDYCAPERAHNVVMYSGGIASFAAAMMVKNRFGPGRLTLLFADTLMEDPDLYRFLMETVELIKPAHFVRLEEGRDPWQVFKDVRFLGNTRVDPCSRILKRELMHKWMRKHHSYERTRVHLGFDWTELHRVDRAKKHWDPWFVECPLAEWKPYLTKGAIKDMLKQYGIKLPQLYRDGFPHNNCGGFCIKAGHAHFKHLLDVYPERYAHHEEKEQELRDYLGKGVAILRDRQGGDTKPVTMRVFRERIEAGGQWDMIEWGGCNCMDTE